MKKGAIARDHARKIGDDWKDNEYYDLAESREHVLTFWKPTGIFRRLFDRLDTAHLVELACGHGRHTQYYIDHVAAEPRGSITLMDINIENIDFCKKRFEGQPGISYFQNNGRDLSPLESGSATAIFCYDAMVHFEVSSIATYLADTYRTLKPGGRALFHHSNWGKSPGAEYWENPHARNFMTKNLFAHMANREGLTVLRQQIISWGKPFRDYVRNVDCVSLVEKTE